MSKQEEIKQALAAATPGPWTYDETCGDVHSSQTDEIICCPSVNDGKLIAKAPEYIAYLLEENERLHKELALKDATIADLNHNRRLLSKEIEEVRKELSYPRLRPLEEWDEDYGDVLWWELHVAEPPYCGNPLCSDWPGYHTHWTPIVAPNFGQEGEGNQ